MRPDEIKAQSALVRLQASATTLFGSRQEEFLPSNSRPGKAILLRGKLCNVHFEVGKQQELVSVSCLGKCP